jgi:hypothetical protein
MYHGHRRIRKGASKSHKNNIVNKIIVRKEMVIQVQEDFRTTKRKDQKGISPHHITVKTLSIQSKERILKSVKEKH